MLKKPGKLKIGDHVGVFAPSSPVKDSYRQKGLEAIRNLGFHPREAPNILQKNDFLTKPTEENTRDIQEFFDTPDIKALWAARGGYGSNLLLPFLSKLKIEEHKIVIGSSDVSYLLWYLMDRLNLVVFYGPMAYSSLSDQKADLKNLMIMLMGDYEEVKIPGSVLKPGFAEGIVTGGCLSNFVSLIGTEYLPKVENRILLLEDVGERPYRLDRMFWQIYNTGIFSRISGLILGEFPNCFKTPDEKEFFFSRVLSYLSKVDIPVISDLPFGHSHRIHTLPLGINVQINTADFPCLLITEKAVL
jgi:muramoyltetrapeptide carboxypeptidase